MPAAALILYIKQTKGGRILAARSRTSQKINFRPACRSPWFFLSYFQALLSKWSSKTPKSSFQKSHQKPQKPTPTSARAFYFICGVSELPLLRHAAFKRHKRVKFLGRILAELHRMNFTCRCACFGLFAVFLDPLAELGYPKLFWGKNASSQNFRTGCDV
jgi:hypothetical protein